MAVLQWIRILAIISLTRYVSCQEGLSEQDLLRLQQLSSSVNGNDGNVDSIPSYNSNNIYRGDTNNNDQALSSMSLQSRNENTGNDQQFESRRERRKIFHIKNPFQRQLDESQKNADNYDTDTGASDQYASMQYSLPPEEFLNQLRRENQQNQQQYSVQQFSTPAPGLGSYSASPQPQYQYLSNPSSYDGSQAASNQLSQAQGQLIGRNGGNTQYVGSPSSIQSDSQPTSPPLGQYVSTPLPNTFVGTPANIAYVSSIAPGYLSSPSSSIQFVSSQSSVSGPDYRVVSPSSPSGYDNVESNKNINFDHYNDASGGVRYPYESANSYQNEIQSSTANPLTLNNNNPHDPNAWPNSVSKSFQDFSLQMQSIQNQNQNNPFSSGLESSGSGLGSETHRMGNSMAANNLYMNFAQPDYQFLQNLGPKTRDLEQETGQPEAYSHGDYGWKLHNKKQASDSYASQSSSQVRSQNSPTQSESSSFPRYSSLSQINYQNSYGKPSSSSPESLDPDSFAKAAAKAQEKQQQKINEPYHGHNYPSMFGSSGFLSNPNNQGSSNIVTTFYGNQDKQTRPTKYISDSPSTSPFHSNSQEVVTAPPYLYANVRDSYEQKSKPSFDHTKALKNIVSIDASNVLPGYENEKNGNGNKEQSEQNLKQMFSSYKPLADAYYKDKNSGYSFNIKSKPDNYISPTEGTKIGEPNYLYYNNNNNKPNYESYFNQQYGQDTKRFADAATSPLTYLSQNGNPQSDIFQFQGGNRQQDLNEMLKLSDVPYKLTPSNFYINNNNNVLKSPETLPQPLPNRINQNLGNHQLDVAADILSKIGAINANKLLSYTRNNEIDPQTGAPFSTVNGFRVSNPYNVDLKLVSDMLKGKPAVDETRMIPLRDQFSKPLPVKLDMSSLQQLLAKSEQSQLFNQPDPYSRFRDLKTYDYANPTAPRIQNLEMDQYGGYSSIADLFGPPRHPFQGAVKYSRSQEEEESSLVPVADASNTHPIGAVIEQGDVVNNREMTSGTELTDQEEELDLNSYKPHQPNKSFKFPRDHKQRHPNSLFSGRNSNKKIPKINHNEPYPLLRPPPQRNNRKRTPYPKNLRGGRRRRLTKVKSDRMQKVEPLFDSDLPLDESESQQSVSTVLKPPSFAENKSDTDDLGKEEKEE